VEAPLNEIHSVRRSRVVRVESGKPGKGVPHLVSNTALRDFRCALLELDPTGGSVALTEAMCVALRVKTGDPVRLVIA
ncbi:MAG: arginine N-succinyltransferase, partial [Hydrocarboniphaga effusa]|nr:arginine N-succinyltransferase [Hydrocarboniphaga effusa]